MNSRELVNAVFESWKEQMPGKDKYADLCNILKSELAEALIDNRRVCRRLMHEYEEIQARKEPREVPAFEAPKLDFEIPKWEVEIVDEPKQEG